MDLLVKEKIEKKIRNTKLLKEGTDLHCHILPNVDDGVREVEVALKALDYFKEVGYKRVFLTPHIKEEFPRNNAARLQKHFDAFKPLAPEGLELQLAAEYMLDHSFSTHLKDGLLTYDGKKALVETNFLVRQPHMTDKLEELLAEGYTPVLAHPERYEYMDLNDYKQLKAVGCLFQLNYLSLGGYYGEEIREKALRLLSLGFYHYAATDSHRYMGLKNGIDTLLLSEKVTEQLTPLFANNRKL